MTTALALPSFASFQPNALILGGSPSIDELMGVAYSIELIDNGSPWWKGDILRLAERLYGDDCWQLVPDEGVKSWQKSYWLGGIFPPSRRRNMPISFGHHESVAALDDAEQERFLNLAEANNWTVKELRAAVKGEDNVEKVSWEEKFDRLVDFALQARALMKEGDIETAIQRIDEGIDG